MEIFKVKVTLPILTSIVTLPLKRLTLTIRQALLSEDAVWLGF